MKKVISYLAASIVNRYLPLLQLQVQKSLQSFNATFPNAKNVKWMDDKDGYFVSFYQDDNFEKVLYNKEGDFVCSWRYSEGKDLPTNILMILNKKYNADKIIGVTELTTQGNVTYDIKLNKGDKLYAVIMQSDGTITKEQKFDYQAPQNN